MSQDFARTFIGMLPFFHCQLTIYKDILGMDVYYDQEIVVSGKGLPAGVEIIETYDARKIKIKISGKNKRDFMTIITEALDKINGQFEKMNGFRLL